jgi:hypothetical protein
LPFTLTLQSKDLFTFAFDIGKGLKNYARTNIVFNDFFFKRGYSIYFLNDLLGLKGFTPKKIDVAQRLSHVITAVTTIKHALKGKVCDDCIVFYQMRDFALYKFWWTIFVTGISLQIFHGCFQKTYQTFPARILSCLKSSARSAHFFCFICISLWPQKKKTPQNFPCGFKCNVTGCSLKKKFKEVFVILNLING